MRQKILFVLACVMLYVFLFGLETLVAHPIVIATFTSVGVAVGLIVKKVLTKGITWKLFMSWLPTLTWSLLMGLKRIVIRYSSKSIVKYFLVYSEKVRNRYIDFYIWFDAVRRDFQMSTQTKVYVGIILLPITLPLLIYLFFFEYLRRLIARKFVEIGMGGALEKVLPKPVWHFFKNINAYIHKKAINDKNKAALKKELREQEKNSS